MQSYLGDITAYAEYFPGGAELGLDDYIYD